MVNDFFVFFLYGLSASFLLFLLPVLRVVRLCGAPGRIAAYVGIFLEVLQLSGICVHFQVGTECLVVGAFQVRYEYGFSVLQVGPFLCREYMPVYFRRNDRHLALAETVRCTRVLRPARFMSSLTKEENSSPLRLIMFSRKTGCPLRSASLSSEVSSPLQISFGMYISPFSGLWRVYYGRPVTLSSVTKEENSAPSVRFMSSTRMVCPSLSILIWLGESCTPPRLCWLNPLLSG